MMLPSLVVPTLAVLLLGLHPGDRAQGLPSPVSVWFKAEFFHHVLYWTPSPNQSESTYYEVEIQRYGQQVWTPVPSCKQTLALSCDVTMKTLDLYHSHGYLAQVRAVKGDQHSNWTETNTRFSKDEVTLTIGSLKLDVSNNFIFVTIEPPRPRIAPPEDTYEKIFPDYEYAIDVRKMPENYTNVINFHKKKSFNFSVAERVGEFCVKVKPAISSSTNPGLWLEKCVKITQHYITATSILIFIGLVLLLFGVLASSLGFQLYMRHSRKLPSVLVLKESPPLDLVSQPPHPDFIHPLDQEAFPEVCPKLQDAKLYGNTDKSFGTGIQLSLPIQETHFLVGPQTDDTLEKIAALQVHQSASNNSTDSGICLQETSLCPGSGVHWEPRGENDSGVSLAQNPEGQPAYEESGSATDQCNPLGPEEPREEDPVEAAFHGYLKQTRDTEKTVQESCLKEEPCSQHGLDPKFQACLEAEVGWPPPALAKGYVKQDNPGRTLVPEEASAEQWNHPTEEWSLLAMTTCGDLGAPGWGFAHDLAPLDLGATSGSLLSSLDSDLVSLPLISSLHVDE